ncbi:DgyrCDS110 [Dimorphilus gyrociliatus]|uniref:DgyrCDS110 n=1 Tax=Dimorphilus gyrociliatus TaxID=2664684 RepID=A0A7I8V3M7_9ANNE|nr:DgyrCDS110 [Dimorphilus gyrociliatus]
MLASRVITLYILITIAWVVNGQSKCRGDIGLIIDDSGSITDTDPPSMQNWIDVKNFIFKIIDKFEVTGDRGTHFAANRFSNRANVVFQLNQYTSKSDYKNAIERMRYSGGNTNTSGGLLTMLDEQFTEANGNRPDARDIFILITDGKPTRDIEKTPQVIKRIHDMNIRLIGVGVTAFVNETQMREFVRDPDCTVNPNHRYCPKETNEYANSYLEVERFDQLDGILDDLIEGSCATLKPTTPATAQPRFSTLPAPGFCLKTADILFMLDASGSMGYDNFMRQKEFVKSIITDFTIGTRSTRVAVVTFTGDATVNFRLNAFNSREDIIKAIDAIQFKRNGQTRTDRAIARAYNDIFQRGNGARDDQPDIVVLLTDGGSNSKRETMREIHIAKTRGLHFIVLGIGKWLDIYELQSLASYSHEENLIRIDSYRNLPSVRTRLRNLVCRNIDPCQGQSCSGRGQCVSGAGSFTCKCNTGFGGRTCNRKCQKDTMDLAIALDSSGSMQKMHFRKTQDFVNDIILGVNVPNSRISVQKFSTDTNTKFYLDQFSDRQEYLNAMNFYFDGGKTETNLALEEMRSNQLKRGQRSNVRKVGVLLTDGKSNKPDKTFEQAVKLRNEIDGATILGVAIGNANEDEMKAIVNSPTDRNLFKVPNFDSFNQISNQLLDAVCDNTNECQNNPCANSGTCVDKVGGFECLCPPAFRGSRCQTNIGNWFDLVIVLDVSGSIRRERLRLVKDWVISFLDDLPIDQERIRVGLLKYSDSAAIEFQLNTYKSKQDVLEHIRRVEFVGGRTHTAEALRVMHQTMFTSGNGDRSGSQFPNYALVFTDGSSNINAAQTIPEAINSKIKGIHITVVSIGNMVNWVEVRGIASEPWDRNIIQIRSQSELSNYRSTVLTAFSNNQNECNGACRNNAQCDDMLYGFNCRCQGSWGGERCDRQCSRSKDVTFIVDVSGSVDNLFNVTRNIIKRVIHGLPMQNGRFRFAMVSYSDRAEVNFYLNTYDNKLGPLYSLAWSTTGGRTNAAESIRLAYNNVFNGGRGDRGGSDNVAIIFTDAKSNVNAGNTRNEARNMRQRNIEVFVVALDDPQKQSVANMNEANEMASDPDSSHVYRVRRENEVNQAADQLISWICQ